ncbi:type VI secretion system tip protein TssI/VgrG [Yoonia sp. SS1-5]|uniref:Type VI secretion system Vgr family protein n=1 Tax=Yoonia rhodophyticola TaxID=3137370 RepID=A0AAN0MFZ1_9RHOB
MNFTFRQEDRVGKLHTGLGEDVLVLQRFEGADHVNDLFDYRVEALSLEANIDFDQLIGTHMTVELGTMHHDARYFDGIVTEAEWVGTNETANVYRFQLRPWFWLADKRRNQRIFHNMTPDAIIGEVFSYWAGQCDAAVDTRLVETYPELEYTVQYQESDLNFVRRLMEQFGMSFHFKHEEGSHTLVLTDSLLEFDPIPGDTRTYNPNEGMEQSEGEYFWKWKPKRHLTTGAVRMTDYNFKKPNATMEADHVSDAAYAQGQIETYDYPGDYLELDDGKTLSRLRTQQERSADYRHMATGNTMSLASGMTMTLAGEHAEGVADIEYLCLSAHHTFLSESYGSEAGGSDESYTGQYAFTPLTAPYAPQRVTPTPRIHGPQTATVVGEGEIDCDEFGRILVHFPWDLAGANSMRCRVAQISAHQGWGAMVLPRIGMEVVVEYLDGDPTKPLVTGCVYNGSNMPPYELPANKSQSGFLSVSHEGSGRNELRFEDQSGSEEIYMHAQKDHNTTILNNETHSIGVDRSKTVGNDQTETIGHDKTITVGNNHTESIAVNKSMTLGQHHDERIGGAMSIAVALGMSTAVGTAHSLTVGANASQQVGKDKSLTVSGNEAINIGGNQATQVGAKKTIVVEDELSIQVGKAKLLMKKDGTITLTGKDITINGDGNVSASSKKKVGIKASSSVTIKGSKLNMN